MACHLRHRRAQTWPAATYDGEYSGVLSTQLQGPFGGVSLQFLIDDMGGIMTADAPGFRYSPKPLPNGCDCHLSRSSPGSSSTCGSSTASTSSSSQQSSCRSTSASSTSSDTGPAPSGMSVRRPLSTDHGPSHSGTSYGVTPARPAHSDNPAPGGHKRRWSSLSFHLKRLSGAFDSLQTYGTEHSSTSPGSGQGHYLRARDVGSNMPTHYNRRPPSMPVSPFSDGSELSDIDHDLRHFDRQEECDDRAEDEQSQRSGYSEASRHDASRDDRRASLPAYGDQSSHTQSVHLDARMSLRSLGSDYPECSSAVPPSNALRFSSLHLDLKDSELYYLRELPATPSPPPALEVTPFASCTSFGILEDTLVDCSPTLAPSLPPGSILPPLLDSNNDGDQSQASRNPSPLLSSASSGALTPPGHLLSTPLDLRSHQMLPDTVPIELVSDSLGDTQPLRFQRSSAHSHPNSPSITPKVSHETFVFGDLHPTSTPDTCKPYEQDMQPRSVDFNDAALSRLTGSRYDGECPSLSRKVCARIAYLFVLNASFFCNRADTTHPLAVRSRRHAPTSTLALLSQPMYKHVTIVGTMSIHSAPSFLIFSSTLKSSKQVVRHHNWRRRRFHLPTHYRRLPSGGRTCPSTLPISKPLITVNTATPAIGRHPAAASRLPGTRY